MERTEIIGELAKLALQAEESNDIPLVAALAPICVIANSSSKLRDMFLGHLAQIGDELAGRLSKSK